MMRQFLVTTLWLMPTMTFGATIYVDGTLPTNCTSGKYSVANRSCSGADGNAYRDIRSALNASGPGDTINLRGGTITSNVRGDGIHPQASQTWQAYNDESVTITTGSHKHVFAVYGADNVTIQDLTLTGGTESGVHALVSDNLVLRNLDVSGYNTSGVEYNHGILLSDWGSAMRNFLVEGCHVHDAAIEMYWSAGIGVGGESSGGTIRNNRVTNTDTGIWLDVDAGNPNLGYTPHLVQSNVVEDIWTVCYHIEHGAAWIMEQNIANGCGLEGIRVRPSSAGMTGHRYYNNTISGARHALWISNYKGDEQFTDSQFKNNIFMSRHASNPAVNIARPNHLDSTVIFENNCIRNLGGGPGVCWGDASGIFTALCEPPGVSYADTAAGYAAWQAAAPNVRGVSTGDSCNSYGPEPGGDTTPPDDTITSPVGDTTPPEVTITSPADGASVQRKSTVTIAATASDGGGVVRVEVNINSSVVCTATMSPYNCIWTVPAASGRTYQLQAKAYDASGNVGLSSLVTVRSQ